MKTKRLRALLVAGLLSLAPAVTLTSCGGGGGGGGGGGSSEDGDIDITMDSTELPSSISGKTLKIATADGTERTVTFSGDSVALVSYYATDGQEHQVGGRYAYSRTPVGKTSASLKIEYHPSSSQTMTYTLAVQLTSSGVWETSGYVTNSQLPGKACSVTNGHWSN